MQYLHDFLVLLISICLVCRIILNFRRNSINDTDQLIHCSNIGIVLSNIISALLFADFLVILILKESLTVILLYILFLLMNYSILNSFRKDKKELEYYKLMEQNDDNTEDIE